MSCLTTTEKAKAIVGCVFHELNSIKSGKENNEEFWLMICFMIKSYEDKQLANIGCIAAIAEWYNIFNEDTKENQALLLRILSYYYDVMNDNGGFCLDCPHCKPLLEKGIHKKTLIKRWIKQVRHEKCACGNTLIWEAYCNASGLDEDYYKETDVIEKIGEGLELIHKALKDYDINDDIKEKISFVNSLETNKELVEYCRLKKVKQSIGGVTNKYVKRLNILEHLLGRKYTKDEENQVEWG